jgi:hypothetical protein
MRGSIIVLVLGWAAALPAAAGDAAALPACSVAVAVEAQAAPPSAPSPAYDADLDLDPAEPDFTVIDLPTNLRVPKHKLAFRLTHRFARPLGEGSFSDLAADFFGFDSAAQIGFGLRFGLFRGGQLGLYRTSDRTIQVHAQQEVLREGGSPVGMSLALSVEGLDNFGLSAPPEPPPLHEFQPAIALVLSRRLGTRGAFYAVPSWVGHTRIDPQAPGTDDSTVVLGLGARLRVTRTMSLVGEYHPRLAGYKGDLGSGATESVGTFGIEGRVGGHSFQLNFSNALGTTPAQIARGQQGRRGWFIGFNLSRKFF